MTVVLAWWFWVRDPESGVASKWRKIALVVGLISATLNVVLFAYLALWLHFHYTPESWKVQEVCGNIGIISCVAAFVGSAAGEGDHRARILVSVSAVLGFVPWIPIGIL